MAKYVFVTGGVLSSLGKGITASSIGAIFKSQGYSVMIRKFDPYLNFNPGHMSPLQHGEVFVTEDGGEGDLDLGHYERFIDTNTTKNCDLTSGQIYYNVIEKERRGGFLGGTVQVIPHITDEIKNSLLDSDGLYDIIIVEIGGTVGDIEGLPFLEAIRQMRYDLGNDEVAYVHVTPLLYIKTAGELKTKPTQHSVQKLREIGITPDMIICRSEYPMEEDIRKKIALFCNVATEAVISAIDASPLYQVTLNLYQEGAAKILLNKLKLENRPADLSHWENLIMNIKNPKHQVSIGVVGKYTDMKDAYISLSEAITHGGVANEAKVDIRWISAEELECSSNPAELLDGLSGILIPGGFGERGMEGKIRATNYARTKDIPFFGLGSLGMQCAILEYARNVMKLNAGCVEVSPNTEEPVITCIDKNCKPTNIMGDMRLGARTSALSPGSLISRIYGAEEISERHRHRLEFNNAYKQPLIDAGMSITAIDKELDLVDAVELKSHRWFIGCQFLPEYKSRPLRPHPLFAAFIDAALKYKTANPEA